jgi:hypothetical protein
MQMTTVVYISVTHEIVKASWSLFQHDGVAAFTLSERSPLPQPLSAKDLPGGHTRILNVRRIRRINHHPVESDMDSPSESISDTDNWLNWNGDLDNPNDSQDDYTADNKSDMERGNTIEDLESPKQRDMSAAPSVSNRSKFPVRFRVQFQSGTGPFQWVSTKNPAFQIDNFGSN